MTPTFEAHTSESDSETPLSIWGSWRGKRWRTNLCRPAKICSSGRVRLSCSTEIEPGRYAHLARDHTRLRGDGWGCGCGCGWGWDWGWGLGLGLGLGFGLGVGVGVGMG